MGYEDDRWRRPDSNPSTSKNNPVIKGAVDVALPTDIHILPGDKKRIGSEQRQRIADHLSAAYGLGFLTDEEHDARRDYVMHTAQSREDLDQVTRDLPPVPRTPPGTRIVAEPDRPVLDFLGNPIVTAAVIAGGVPVSVLVAGNFAFIFAIMVMVAALGLFFRWLTRHDA